MKKKILIRATSFLLAGLLLWEAPLQVYGEEPAVENEVLEEAEAETPASEKSATEAPENVGNGELAEATENEENGEFAEADQNADAGQQETEDEEQSAFFLDVPVVGLSMSAPTSALLRWTAVPEAQGYRIYRDEELLGAIGAETAEYEDAAVEADVGHTYKVEAYAVVEEQEYTSEGSVSLAWDLSMGGVQVTSAVDPDGALVLSWEAAPGAEGYLVYCKKDDAWSLAGDVTETAAVFSDVSEGMYALYQVIPYRTEEEGVIYGTPSEETEAGIPLQKVTLQASPSGYNRIVLTWEKNEAATGYRLYRRQGDGEYILLKKIASNDVVRYVDTGLSFHVEYEYKIYPVIESDGIVHIGEESDGVVQRTKLGTPVVGEVSCVDYETLAVTWKGVPGAEGYEIYRAVSEDGDWKRVARTAASAGCSYENNGLTLEKVYYYKVRAYRMSGRERVYGEFSEVQSGHTQLSQVTGLTASAAGYNKIRLSWEKSGAQRYQIYYATEENGAYRYLASVAGTAFEYTGAICGQQYWFQVRGACEIGEHAGVGAFSAAASARTTIARPSLKSAVPRYDRITISWGKVDGALEYELYYSAEKDGEYTLLASTSDTSYSHQGLDVGETYFYKVRAVRQKFTTEFSGALSGTTRLDSLTGLTAVRSGTNIVVSWNQVEGVTGYIVKRAASSGGTYEEIAKVSGTSYTDTERSRTTTYFYKVVGVRGDHRTNEAGPVKVPGESVGWKTSYGIDVSAYQGEINWTKVSNAGIDFAMLRIITGKSSNSTTLDTQFENNYRRARRNDVKVGVYRYSYATTASGARREATKVIEALNGRALDYPIVMDVEDSSVLSGTASNYARSRIILAFKEVVEDAGYRFALYANKNWLDNYLDMDMLSGCDIWIARWRSVDKGHGYTGKGTVTMWQYSSSGRVDGIAGDVDLDICYRDY